MAVVGRKHGYPTPCIAWRRQWQWQHVGSFSIARRNRKAHSHPSIVMPIEGETHGNGERTDRAWLEDYSEMAVSILSFFLSFTLNVVTCKKDRTRATRFPMSINHVETTNSITCVRHRFEQFRFILHSSGSSSPDEVELGSIKV